LTKQFWFTWKNGCVGCRVINFKLFECYAVFFNTKDMIFIESSKLVKFWKQWWVRFHDFEWTRIGFFIVNISKATKKHCLNIFAGIERLNSFLSSFSMLPYRNVTYRQKKDEKNALWRKVEIKCDKNWSLKKILKICKNLCFASFTSFLEMKMFQHLLRLTIYGV